MLLVLLHTAMLLVELIAAYFVATYFVFVFAAAVVVVVVVAAAVVVVTVVVTVADAVTAAVAIPDYVSENWWRKGLVVVVVLIAKTLVFEFGAAIEIHDGSLVFAYSCGCGCGCGCVGIGVGIGVVFSTHTIGGHNNSCRVVAIAYHDHATGTTSTTSCVSAGSALISWSGFD